MRAKVVIVVQAIIIAILLSIILFQHFHRQNQTSFTIPANSLISPRVYAGIVEPNSFLIVNFVPLKKELQAHIQENNLTMSVYVINLRNGASMSINPNQAFPPASLTKVPMAILIMKQIEENKLSLDTQLQIQESDKDSASGHLYQTTKNYLPVRVLLEEMLRDSDNTAQHVLMRYLEQTDQEILFDYWDYFSKDSSIQGGDKGGLVTPRSVYNVFLSLYLSTVLESGDSEYILSLLAESNFNIKKYAQLPLDLIVAHKYGVREDNGVKVFHDCGIMYPQEMKIFYCVMTAHNKDQAEGIKEVGYAVNKIYNYVIDTRKYLDKFKGHPSNDN